MLPGKIHTRIAPTPSGFLHKGNHFNFILCWLFARKTGGTLRLRIDDIDKSRYRRKYVADILSQLQWLGIDYDYGPTSVVDFEQVYSQQQHLPRYYSLLEQLKEKQRLFACQCSRKQIAQISPDGTYPQSCLNANLPFDHPNVCWRLRTNGLAIKVADVCQKKEVALEKTLGHFIVRKKDGLPSYQIVSVADDVSHGVNFIVRGKDLLGSSIAQTYLSTLLPSLACFQTIAIVHHGLITDEKGEKLSKSAGNAETATEGLQKVDLFNLVGRKVGITEKQSSLQSLLDAFEPNTAISHLCKNN